MEPSIRLNTATAAAMPRRRESLGSPGVPLAIARVTMSAPWVMDIQSVLPQSDLPRAGGGWLSAGDGAAALACLSDRPGNSLDVSGSVSPTVTAQPDELGD